MKRLSLLVGTLGGAMAGYLLHNKKLRDQLANAKDAEEAAKLLGKHLQKDGKKIAKQVQDFVASDDVQKNVGKAKSFAKKKVSEAKMEMDAMVCKGSCKAKKAAKKGATKAKRSVKKSAAKAKRSVKKAVRKKK
ncbi:MAG: hypothetical protein QF741_01915 [Candidatus Peribacteraceae bacterium]|jgi:hypothetical protein|nr:hypothetical protein [Candidatus Peribacteraceae bacterium]MDP7454829.1 hypothetical protein [Candidatus Peribacteraceae bacterium]MDP7646020.1 hypothetical protein [Candidatus Peribacteraceae bacterium]|tara:strand:- start:28 stop:429 length:402 start_codon:yes stop_codon:yes gene_type:complete